MARYNFYRKEELRKAKRSSSENAYRRLIPAFSITCPEGKEKFYARKYDLFDGYIWIKE